MHNQLHAIVCDMKGVTFCPAKMVGTRILPCTCPETAQQILVDCNEGKGSGRERGKEKEKEGKGREGERERGRGKGGEREGCRDREREGGRM